MERKSYENKFKSTPENLPKIENYFNEIFSPLNLPEKKLNLLLLALSEAASNCIKHGNNSDPNKEVQIRIEIDAETIRVELKDEGQGFDPTIIPDPTTPENIMKEHGRGIHIMKAFVDKLTYEKTSDGLITRLEIKR